MTENLAERLLAAADGTRVPDVDPEHGELQLVCVSDIAHDSLTAPDLAALLREAAAALAERDADALRHLCDSQASLRVVRDLAWKGFNFSPIPHCKRYGYILQESDAALGRIADVITAAMSAAPTQPGDDNEHRTAQGAG